MGALPDVAVPLLPCVDLDEAVAFYASLGFVVTHRQKAPNPYAAMRRNGADLHLFGLKGLDPATAFSTCLILVEEVEALHAGFAEALRAKYGKVPVRGAPRISRMRQGQSRFTVVDPSGCSVIFIRRGEGGADADAGDGATALGKAVKTARRLRDFKGDDAAAAKVLDGALAKAAGEATALQVRALAMRAEIAEAMGDAARAEEVRVAMEALGPTGESETAREAGGNVDASHCTRVARTDPPTSVGRCPVAACANGGTCRRGDRAQSPRPSSH